MATIPFGNDATELGKALERFRCCDQILDRTLGVMRGVPSNVVVDGHEVGDGRLEPRDPHAKLNRFFTSECDTVRPSAMAISPSAIF